VTLTAILITLVAVGSAEAGRRSDTAKALNRGLAGTPMAHTGYHLEAAGWRYRISPFLIASIAGTESSFGAAACRSNRFNAFGLSSCGSGWSVPDFRSWRHVYLFMAKFLTDRWPHARTSYDYHGYAACSSCWGAHTAWFMRHRFGVGLETLAETVERYFISDSFDDAHLDALAENVKESLAVVRASQEPS
jgi:hypothetical protein